MSQMQIADNIEQELTAIDKAQKETKQAKVALRNFVLGPNFLILHAVFNQLLSIWADSLLTLVEATGTSFQGEKQLANQLGINLEQENGFRPTSNLDLSWQKGIVLAVAIVGTVLLSVWLHAPYSLPLIVIVLIVGLVFFQQISDYIMNLIKKEKPQLPSLNETTGKIKESLSYMRNNHVERRFLIKFQHSNGELLKDHDPQDEPALFDRQAQTMEEMPSDFMDRIDDITVECNNAAFRRKMVLYAYWRNTSPQTAPQQPQHPAYNQ